MLALLLVTVLVGLVEADPAAPSTRYGYSHRGNYRYASRGHSYSRARYGYGRQHSYGPRNHYHGPKENYDKPLNGIDKLYKRLDTLQSELKTASEIMGNMEARLSLSKKVTDELSFVSVPRLIDEEFEQNDAITRLENVEDTINDKLQFAQDKVNAVKTQNAGNLDDQENVGEILAETRRRNIMQNGLIASLLTFIDDFKPKLTTVIDNEFDVLGIRLSELSSALDRVKSIESKRMCETGQVTLDADDRKAEYLFQSNFAVVPQVLHSICGYNFDMEKRPEADGYYKEPNALGLLVTADASKTGVTLELFDRSFGDTGIVTVDVCFQACSIGPGAADGTSELTYFYSNSG